MSEPTDPDDVEAYRTELSAAVDDGSGCTEMWDTVSKMRDGSPDTGLIEHGRRSFIARVAVTLGVVPLGAATSVSASTDEPDADDALPDITEIYGTERKHLLKRARTSEKVEFVATRLGSKVVSNATSGRNGVSVFEYRLADETTGYGVTFRSGSGATKSQINYYESTAHESGTAVVGSKRSGTGVVTVDANNRTVMQLLETPTIRRVVNALDRNEEYAEFRDGLRTGRIVEKDAVLVRRLRDADKRTEIAIPIETDGEITGRVVLSGAGRPTPKNVAQYSVVGSTDDNEANIAMSASASTKCQAICGVLSAATMFGCTGLCVTNPATAPFAVHCGSLCTAVAGGYCIDECDNII